MKVWIIKKNNKYNNSNELLKKIYFEETKSNIDLKKIKYGINGKPYYDDKFYFNISHSKNYIGIVISKDEVGIDLEEKSRKLYNGFTSKFINQYEEIIDSPINNWVIKEAYSKFLGIGLNMDFKSINAMEILKKKNVYNLSNEDLICYVVGLEQLEFVNYI